MRHYPSLSGIVAAVHALLLPRGRKTPQGRKPRSDELIIPLAVYQHHWPFRYAQDLLHDPLPWTPGARTLHLL